MLRTNPIVVLFMVASTLVSGLPANTLPSEEQYLEELSKLEQHLESPDLSLILAAVYEYGTYNPPSGGQRHIVLLPEAFARQLATQAKGKSRDEFNRLYDAKIGRPCKRVNKLNSDFNTFLHRNPSIANWAHQVGMLPGYWFKVSSACEKQLEEAVRRKVYQQLELMKN